MKHIDLFSGIGGFALATEMVWDNVEHTFCDNEPFAQAILQKHWPQSKIYGDIRTLTANAESEQMGMARQSWQNPFLLTGGFPCQPFSQAGRRKGTADDRYLWPEMLRVIREFRPRWVVGENVSGLATWNDGMVLEQVCADLEGEGYEVQPLAIPAVAVNAPHRRERIWIVAHAPGQRTRGKSRAVRQAQRRPDDERLSRIEHANSNASDTTQRGRNQGGAQRGGVSKREGAMGTKERRGFTDTRDNEHWDQNWIKVATRLCRVDDGVPRRLDRTRRLKGLGNAIVPQVAAEIFKAIKQTDENISRKTTVL